MIVTVIGGRVRLREQKRLETKLRIQDEAFRLVDESGFAATTVEDIAAAAKVSPSTIYRYFGTKEGIFLWDELELPAVELLRTELSRRAPLEAALAALDSLGTLGFHIPENEMRQRARFIYEEPALRAALGEAFRGFERRLTALFLQAGTDDQTSARVLSGVTMTIVSTAIEAWAFADPPVDLASAVSGSIASLHELVSR
jgi:AcrR family transcriptional regulator